MRKHWNPKAELEAEYRGLSQAFGIHSSGWDMVHRNYSPSMFCKENRLALIGEYLTWKYFVERAKKYDVIYYCGIDEFLAEYKDAIEPRVNLN